MHEDTATYIRNLEDFLVLIYRGQGYTIETLAERLEAMDSIFVTEYGPMMELPTGETFKFANLDYAAIAAAILERAGE